VITSDQNVGAKKNCYRTLKACRGKYVSFCEGDDYWHHPLKLRKQTDYLEAHPECGLVFSSYDVYHVGSKKRIKDFIKYRKWEIPEKWDVSDIVEGKHGILTVTVMARRNLCEKIIESDPYLHQSKQFIMGDTQVWAEMATMAQLHYIPESMATYNITGESASRSKDIRKGLRFAISGAELLIYLCKKYNLSPSIRNRHEANWGNLSLRLALHSRNRELADEVRRRKEKLTWKEWLYYYGARNIEFYYLYRLGDKIVSALKKNSDPWK
jgi:glycosyltransferase involved in cell wall biosynthesis